VFILVGEVPYQSFELLQILIKKRNMQKNWYILYIKPKCQKKVASLLSKRKIENFYPVTWDENFSLRKRKIKQEPLFKSYIFVQIESSSIDKIKSLNGVVNFLYWKGSPAIINDEEMRLMKQFISDFERIEVVKSTVNLKEFSQPFDGLRYSFTDNVVIIKNIVAKVNLPSLGFTLLAKLERNDSFKSTHDFALNTLAFESRKSKDRSLLQKLN
jgi:transcription antitermination factor NusG